MSEERGEAGEQVRAYVRTNRAFWNAQASWYERPGRASWASAEPRWGIWQIPEAEAGMLPPEPSGRRIVELGCGTGYVSAWLARRGAHPVGIDNSPAQLATARALQAEHELPFPLVHGDAERLPFPDASFDDAISEYGAAIWCDPHRWIPEAARVLRPGGRLSFLRNHAFQMLFVDEDPKVPAHRTLQRPYFGMHRFDWETGETEFHLPHGLMMSVLREAGFDVLELRELRPSPDARSDYEFVTLDWARQWPCEEVWIARRR